MITLLVLSAISLVCFLLQMIICKSLFKELTVIGLLVIIVVSLIPFINVVMVFSYFCTWLIFEADKIEWLNKRIW
jgi:hypothetical protein